MYFFNHHHTAANIRKLVRATTGRSPASGGSARKDFIEQLATLQSLRLSRNPASVVSYDDGALASALAERGMFRGEGLEVGAAFDESEREIIRRNVEHAFVLIRALSPQLAEMVESLVADIVCVRVEASGGGTSSNLLGIIWLSPHRNWTTIDYAECLVHEAMHLNVFLGDMLYGIYQNPRAVKDTLVISAIRKVPRAIDKALHSACVAVALIHFYALLRDDKTVESFLSPLYRCVADLAGHTEVLTPYGAVMVDALNDFVKNPDLKRLADRFGDPSCTHMPMPGSGPIPLRRGDDAAALPA